MSVSELYAVWIGVLPGRYSTTPDGEMVIAAMGRGQRIPMPGVNWNLQRISCDHRIVGYGHVVTQLAAGEAVPVRTADLEPTRALIERELARLGVEGHVHIRAERITPLDGHDVR